MELCLATEIHLGTRVYKPWWYKESLYLEGVRMVAYGRRGRGGEDGVDTGTEMEY